MASTDQINAEEIALQTHPASALVNAETDTDKDGETTNTALPRNPSKEDLQDLNLVVFAMPFDADNPRCWKVWKKWNVTSAMSATTFMRMASSSIMAPAISSISRDLKMSSVQAQMALSIYLLASAFGPLILAPLSEIYGRKRVLHVSNVWFLVFNLACGFAKKGGTLIAVRCLAGFGGSVAYALGNAVLSDIWAREQRGRSLGLYMMIPLLGIAIGPIAGGYITEYLSWRWVFWILSIFQAALVLASFFFFQESFAPVILARRAAHLRKVTTNPDLHTVEERLERGQSISARLFHGLTRPLRLLALHPTVQIVTVLQGVSYGILYLFISTFATIWTAEYGFSVSESGLQYIAHAIGVLLAAEIGGPLMDIAFGKFKERQQRRSPGSEDLDPEIRIPFTLPGILLVPTGLIIYGWSAQMRYEWVIVDIGVVVMDFGMQVSGQALQAYIMDAYGAHTGSATAASQFLRSVAAFAFPLCAPSLYKTLGYGWGNSLLGLLFAGLGLPGILTLWLFGKKLRSAARDSW